MLQVTNRAYRWVIVFAGCLGLLASLGLGRFSLGMMLPGMGEGLHLNYSQMGLVSTINFCGYLAAVLWCGRFTSLIGTRYLVFLGLLLVGSSMILVGKSSYLPFIMVLYCVTGVGSALSNVPIMALISRWFDPKKRGMAAGLCVMGNGLGILLSAQLVPTLGEFSNSWRLSWLVLGGLVLVIALVCLALVRNAPFHEAEDFVQSTAEDRQGVFQLLKGDRRRVMLHSGVLYFLFGCTYVVYVTFFVTSLVQEHGFSELGAGKIWSWVGFISLCSGPLFGAVSDRYGRRLALTLVFLLQSLAYILVALELPLIAIYCSVLFFGLTAFSVPTVIAAYLGDHTGPANSATAFGFVTFIFGTGQILGPALAGWLAEHSNSFTTSFFLISALTATATILSLLLPDGSRRVS